MNFDKECYNSFLIAIYQIKPSYDYCKAFLKKGKKYIIIIIIFKKISVHFLV